jgi:hypothetical protein
VEIVVSQEVVLAVASRNSLDINQAATLVNKAQERKK